MLISQLPPLFAYNIEHTKEITLYVYALSYEVLKIDMLKRYIESFF